MDYARVDAHPRSMLHWAAKTNHQPLKGRSLAKTHRRLNPTSISHRIVSSPTRTCVYVRRVEKVPERVSPLFSRFRRFLTLFRSPSPPRPLPFRDSEICESEAGDRQDFTTDYYEIFNISE